MRISRDTETRSLIQLLRIALGNATESDFAIDASTNWEGVIDLAEMQGVTGIAFEGMQCLLQTHTADDIQLPRRTKMRWISSTSDVEQTYRRQFHAAERLSSLFAENGIRTFVLKGIAMSKYYPVPEHREFGDLDCFLDGAFEQGNSLAEDAGYEVDRSYYKHSHIRMPSLEVENHQFCLPIRGSRRRKQMEVYLEQLLREYAPHHIDETAMLLPPPTFNAIFLTFHAASHFLAEGIVLRHILDWALLVEKEQNSIDWKAVYHHLDRIGYTNFARIMTTLARDVFNVRIVNAEIRLTSSTRTRRLLKDSLRCQSRIYSSGNSNTVKRLNLVYNYLVGAWKYHTVFHQSAIWEVVRSTVSYFIEKNPRLK